MLPCVRVRVGAHGWGWWLGLELDGMSPPHSHSHSRLETLRVEVLGDDGAAAAPLPLEGPPADVFVDMLAELEQVSKRRRQQQAWAPKAGCVAAVAAVQDPGDLGDDDPIAAMILELMAEDADAEELRGLISAGDHTLADEAAELEEVVAEENSEVVDIDPGIIVPHAAPSSSGASSSSGPPPPPIDTIADADAQPPSSDMDEMLERLGLSRGVDPLDILGPTGKIVGRMNNVGPSVQMTCKRNHGKCRLWINITMERPKHMILQECFKWIAQDCSTAQHQLAGVAAKTALGMKCRPSRRDFLALQGFRFVVDVGHLSPTWGKHRRRARIAHSG